MAQDGPTSQPAVFVDGSAGAYPGDLDADASRVLNKALELLLQALQPAGLETMTLPPGARASAADARALAQFALVESDVRKKLVLAMAASYAAQIFGLPRNTLAYTIDQVCGMYAMSASQRRMVHENAAAALDLFVATKKGAAPMSGVYKDGVLGGAMFQPGSFQDGSLGILMHQSGAFRDGSLGALMAQPVAFQDGSLGRVLRKERNRRPTLRGLGGGCGCSGVGADSAVAETPMYKKPLVIGGAVVGLGLLLFLVKRK